MASGADDGTDSQCTDSQVPTILQGNVRSTFLDFYVSELPLHYPDLESLRSLPGHFHWHNLLYMNSTVYCMLTSHWELGSFFLLFDFSQALLSNPVTAVS